MFYFDESKFCKDAKRAMRRYHYSYRTLASELKLQGHTTLYRVLNQKQSLSMKAMIHISNTLDLNPYEYIEETEVQLELWSEL